MREYFNLLNNYINQSIDHLISLEDSFFTVLCI